MANYFYRQVMKARQEIARNPRKCDLCGEIETVENVMLEYENGLVMCDDCAFKYYEKQEKEDGENDDTQN